MRVYEFTVRPVAPFQFTPHLDRFTLAGRPTPFIWLTRGKLLRLAVKAGDGFVAADAVFRGEPWSPAVQLRVHADDAGRAREARDVFAEMVRASFDYKEFMDAVRGMDERLHGLVSRYPGLRPGRCMSLYAALIDSVVKQRIALPVALRLYSRLVEKYGARVRVGDTTYYWHPLPDRLVEARVEELRGLGLTRVKARAVREIALAEAEKRLPSIDEAAESPEQVVRELTRLYGVGPWTAQIAVAMVSRGFPLGPTGDLAVARGLATVLNLGKEEAKTLARRLLEHLPGLGGLVLYLAAYEYEESKRRRRRRIQDPSPDPASPETGYTASSRKAHSP